MSQILETIRKHLKEKKIHYCVEDDTVTLLMGTFCGSMFFEKFDDEDDYNMVTIWCHREDEFDDNFSEILNDDLTNDSIIVYVDELIDTIRDYNNGINKVSIKVNEIFDLGKQYQIQLNLIESIFNSKFEEYNDYEF